MRIGPITISWTKAERNEQRLEDAMKASDAAEALAIEKEYEGNRLLACSQPFKHQSKALSWT